MSNDFSAFRVIIDDLEQGIFSPRLNWEKDNPNCESKQLFFKNREDRRWLHGGDRQEAAELEQWLFDDCSHKKTAKSEALNHYSKWAEFILEEGIYADFTEKDLPRPEKNEFLEDYLQRLVLMVENMGRGPKKSWRALKSFLAFLRSHNDQEEVAFIEHIFPQKMDLHNHKIIRKIWPQVYPIPQEIAAAIIKELAYQCAYGRPNARHISGEALTLCWLCLTASRLRLLTSLEMIHCTRADAVFLGKSPELLVPTKFGNQKVRISQRVAKFFKIVSRIPSPLSRDSILQSDLHDLRRPLNTVIERVNPGPDLGKITFLSFLSPPHQAGIKNRYNP